MEHIWVNAYVDYIPSRGEVNIEGDSWLGLDPSFKQTTYFTELDLSTYYPSLTTPYEQAFASGTVDSATGSITELDITPVKQVLDQAEGPVSNLFDTEYPDGAAQGNIYPIKQIVAVEYPLLVQQLPYQILSEGIDFPEMPDRLRHHVTIALVDSTGNTDFTFSQPLPQYSKKKIVAGIGAATMADAQVVASLWDGVAEDVTTIPLSLLARIIHVVSHLRIDGEIVASGPSEPMGLKKTLRIHFDAPTIDTPDYLTELMTGELFAIGIDPQMISLKQTEQAQAQMNTTVQAYTSDDFGDIAVASLVDDPYSAILFSYFSATDSFAVNTGSLAGIASVRYPSAGTYSYRFQSESIFGNVSTVSPSSFVLDIGRDYYITTAKDGDIQKEAEFLFLLGAVNSSYESLIPELLIPMNGSSVENSGSTTTILAEANQAGIPIHLIRTSNLSSILPLLQYSSEEKSRIQDAVNAGKEVIIPERPLAGSASVAKIVLDPQTGEAGFLISGQANDFERFCSQCFALHGEARIQCLTGTSVYNPFGDVGCIGAVVASATAAVVAFIAGGAVALESLLASFPGLGVQASLIVAQIQATFASWSIVGGVRGLLYNAYKFHGSATALAGLYACSKGLVEFFTTGPALLEEPTAKLGQLMIGVFTHRGCLDSIKASLTIVG